MALYRALYGMLTQTLTAVGYTSLAHFSFFEVRENTSTQQKSLHSNRLFEPGEMLSAFSAKEIFREPSYLTVQTAMHTHITLFPEYLQYINHSCSPNVFFDTNTMQLVCIKKIEPEDELTFFYPSTEWKMAQPFHCLCGAENCLHEIQGAYYLPDDILNQYRLTSFIQQQMQSRHQ